MRPSIANLKIKGVLHRRDSLFVFLFLQHPLWDLSLFCHYLHGLIQKAHAVAGGALDGIVYIPVSYTHLDVYKRQV